jgi:acyl-CoA synthetase (AMP-forming)/AMP-acid ligase II
MVRKLRNHLCRKIIVSYASTEAGPVASAPYDAIENVPDAVGFVAPDVELQVVDEAGAALPFGADGVIRLRTPHLLLSRETSGAGASADMKESWFYPGDLGHLTEHGVLCVTGRSTDVVNSGGLKISAGKIEEIVQALPEILEAAACGVMGANGLEELWLAVVASGQVDVAAIKRLLQEHKEVGLVAAEVFVLDSLPRGELGKLQRYGLKEQLLKLKRGG